MTEVAVAGVAVGAKRMVEVVCGDAHYLVRGMTKTHDALNPLQAHAHIDHEHTALLSLARANLRRQLTDSDIRLCHQFRLDATPRISEDSSDWCGRRSQKYGNL